MNLSLPAIKTLDMTVARFCERCSISFELVRHSVDTSAFSSSAILERAADGMSRNAIELQLTWMCPQFHLGTIKHPLDWRWAAYDRFAPSWIKRRWPTRMKVWSVYEMFPEVPLPPNHPRSIRTQWTIET